jgi:hypothetical protein
MDFRISKLERLIVHCTIVLFTLNFASPVNPVLALTSLRRLTIKVAVNLLLLYDSEATIEI